MAIEKPEFAAPEVRAAARRRFVLGGGTFFLLGMGCMAVLQGLGPASSPKRATASASITTRQQNQSPSTLATAEPMGAGFEYSSLPLHEPDELLTDTSRPLSSPRWYFGNCSSEQLTALIDSLGLRAQDKAALLEPSRWQASGNGFYLTPPPALVLEMDAATRARLYSFLAAYPENSAQRNPFRFPLDGFTRWFARSDLGAEQYEVLRRLTYTNGETICFCDGSIVQRLFSTKDFRRLVKALYGESTFLMRLRVTPQSDVEAIVNNWAKGRSASAIRPLVEALAKTSGVGSLPISYLLPPFARLRLYTYPNPAADPSAPREDCFWTAMNFFNEQPDPQFFDPEKVSRGLQSGYYQPQDEPAFGDVIVLADAHDKPVHMCVYLADDVVYTKNGMGTLHPWVLMKIPDLMNDYVAEAAVRIRVYRAKKR